MEIVRKTSISQRWEAPFVDEVKRNAEKAGKSITQFTIDALYLLGHLIEYENIRNMRNEDRILFFKELASKHSTIQSSGKSIDGTTVRNVDRGKLENNIQTFLKDNPNRNYSTNELSEILGIVQSTVRTYVKRLEDNPEYILSKGRPNRIMYQG